jgi:acyl-CoA thioester hydrolase
LAFVHTQRIDWADLDLFGHVNNVAFFRYVQAARVTYCEKIGLTSLNESKLSFMVASSQCTFRRPLHFPGEIQVSVKCEWVKNSSFQLTYKLVNDREEMVAEAADVIVIYDHRLKQKAIADQRLRENIRVLDGD